MAFKMKKQSIVQGTKKHADELNLIKKNFDTNMPDGRSKSSPFQEKAPYKRVEGSDLVTHASRAPGLVKDVKDTGRLLKKGVDPTRATNTRLAKPLATMVDPNKRLAVGKKIAKRVGGRAFGPVGAMVAARDLHMKGTHSKFPKATGEGSYKERKTGAEGWKAGRDIVKTRKSPFPKEGLKALYPNPPKAGLQAMKTTRSEAGKEFDKAFAEARKAGKETFTWRGKSYNTKLA